MEREVSNKSEGTNATRKSAHVEKKLLKQTLVRREGARRLYRKSTRGPGRRRLGNGDPAREEGTLCQSNIVGRKKKGGGRRLTTCVLPYKGSFGRT